MATTLEEFKEELKAHHPRSDFFNSDLMHFFSITDIRMLRYTVEIMKRSGKIHTCYVISCLEHNCADKPSRRYYYFDVNTFDIVTTSINQLNGVSTKKSLHK